MTRTLSLIALDRQIAAALNTDPRRWLIWRHEHTTRHPAVPPFLTIHTPTRQLLAVYVRPRRVPAHERPATTLLPDDTAAVLWAPSMRDDITPWLRDPTTVPPGIVLTGQWRTTP